MYYVVHVFNSEARRHFAIVSVELWNCGTMDGEGGREGGTPLIGERERETMAAAIRDRGRNSPRYDMKMLGWYWGGKKEGTRRGLLPPLSKMQSNEGRAKTSLKKLVCVRRAHS